MSTPAWIVAGLAAWVAVGLAVGILVGRSARNRDRQVPRDTGRRQR